MNKKILILALSIVLFAFVPIIDDDVDKLAGSLQNWFDENPQEKIYLHTDKPYYLVGDTIWLKAYLTVGSKHQLSSLSGAMYIDLITESDSIANRLKLPITSGMAMGSVVLHDSIAKEGNYRIRAYTEWMRNAGPDYFYDRMFTVGNAVVNNVFGKIDYLYEKQNNNTNMKAVIKYTNDKGQPYSGKTVRYNLKESYKTISAGGGKTSEAGEIIINLPHGSAAQLNTQYLDTRINITGNYHITKTFPIKTERLSTDVQFFPESGTLINGVRSRIAFKAVGTNGLGVPISGTIQDNENKEIAKLQTQHLGMGSFYMVPESGKNYTAKLRYADGSENTIDLPKAIDNGYVLSVFNNSQKDSVLIRISTNAATFENTSKTVILIGQTSGIPYLAMRIPISKALTSLHLPTKEIPTGIMQFTLFTAEGKPVNERVAFIESDDKIDLQVKSPKQIYKRREKVELNIEANTTSGQPLAGNFSLAVISESAVPSDEANENSIFAQLLLTSDIKGYVEKPNYYFYNQSAKTRSNLDLLMLTQGYRRFNWDQVIANKKTDPIFKAEKLVNQVSGKLLGLNKKPVAAGHVTLLNNKLNLMLDTITNNDGSFRFGNLFITDGINFTIQGKTAKGGNRLMVQMDKISEQDITPNKNIGDMNPNIPELIKESVENSKKQDLELERYGFTSRAQQLREVQIRASKPWTIGNKINENQADEVFRPDTRKPCTTLMECLTETQDTRVRFELRQDTSETNCGTIWVLPKYAVLIDDMLIQSPCDYQSIFLGDISDINKIYINYNSDAISGKMLMGHLSKFKKLPPVMAIYTKSGNFRKSYNPSIVHYAPKGYDAIKEFYSPRYENMEKDGSVTDLRTTVYWNPAVLTKSIGKTKVNYFNADQTGTYRVTVEGIDANGQLGQAVYRYQVE